MNYLLDTNVVSALRRPRQLDHRVLGWIDSIDRMSTLISAITVAELEFGAALAAHKQQAHAVLLRRWIDNIILPGFAGRTIAVDAVIAQRYGHLQVPDPRPFADIMIGATAQVHGMTVVTRNTRHLARFSVPLINPWSLP